MAATTTSAIFVQEAAVAVASSPKPPSSRRFRTVKEAEEYFEAHPAEVPQEADVEPLVDEEFPQATSVPTAKEVNASILQFDDKNANQLPFQVGQWVERLGNDQCWHLEPIRRIILLDDGTYQYKTEAGVLLAPDDVRCSEEGLKRQFGMRPHLWQQWAMFRMEKRLRFQEHHEDDFLYTKYTREARSMWDAWLGDARNADFKQVYDSKPGHVQDKLVHHILSPFANMDEVMHEWDVEDEVEASVFHYNSFLGSGWITSLVVLAIQLSVPFLVLVYTARVSPRFPRFTQQGNSSTVNIALIFTTDWDTFCNNYTPIDQLIMQYIILVVYVIRVFPVVYNTFYVTVGDSALMTSKLNSIRILTFLQGDDNVSMKCGYKLFAYMNSAYIAMINLVLLFVLFLTNSTVDIILNALALEFVANFDKEVASKHWYDGGKRYFRAGVLEIMFRNTLALEHFETEEEFCRTYCVDRAVYDSKIAGPICDAAQATKDALNPRFMDVKDRMWRSMAYVARHKHMRDAVWQYEEQCTTFGVVDATLLYLLPRVSLLRGIFNRYAEYGAWSKFDEALFLPPVPSQVVVNGGGGESALLSFVPGSEIMNFDVDSMVHPMLRFARWVRDALLFSNVVASVQVVYRRAQYALVPFIFIDAVFEWFTFVFIIFFFPAGLLAYLFLVIQCQPLLTSTEQNPIFSADWAFGG